MAKDKNKVVADYGLVRVAAVVPEVNVADVEGNLTHLIEGIDKAVASRTCRISIKDQRLLTID